MFNPLVGTAGEAEGRSFIRTAQGTKGHALFGPYQRLEPGEYAVEFCIARDGDAASAQKTCAVLDVTTDAGATKLVQRRIAGDEIQAEATPFALRFTLDRPTLVEFRAYVTGACALSIDIYRRLVALSDNGADALDAGRFPDRTDIPFLQTHRTYLRGLYERGFGVGVRDDAVVLTIGGISFFARTPDDINFVNELFFENAYNFTLSSDTCVIDIGMNLGLAALQFAAKPEVRRVIAFEPFATTYARACANIALNSALASKITPFNHGLSDQTGDSIVLVAQTADSGAMSTVGATEGIPIGIRLQDAAEALRPIVADAHADGLKLIVKVDCEGSEFAIFASLEAAGLLGQIDAFLVEWHALFAGKSQADLIAPLRRHGFVVFDRSPPMGNGFFYAARITA